MAEEVARLVAVVEANLKGFTKGMEDMQKIADRRFGALEKTIKRTETSFGSAFGRGANALAARFLGIGAAIQVLSRIASEAAKNNQEVIASVERMNAAYARLGESAAPGIAFVNNRLADMLDAVNNVVTALQRAGTEIKNSPLLGGPGGINIPIRENPFFKTSTIDPTTKNVIPAPGGFPVPGVTDVTPKKPPGGETIAEREAKLTIETAQKVADAVREIQERRFKEDNEFRAKQFEEAKALRDQNSAEELDALDQFHEDAQAAWDRYYEGVAERSQEHADFEKTIRDGQLGYAADFFGALSQLSTNASEEQKSITKAAALAEAIILGYLAVQRALAEIPPPLNFAAAAAAGAAAAVQVANIAAREHGGRVQAGTPYIVGEKRPELFVPDSSGTIIPRIPGAMTLGNNGTTANTFHIDARGAQPGVERMIKAAVIEAVSISRKETRSNFASLMVETQRNRL